MCETKMDRSSQRKRQVYVIESVYQNRFLRNVQNKQKNKYKYRKCKHSWKNYLM